MTQVSRRRFFGLAAGSAAVAALPEILLGLGEPPAVAAVVPEPLPCVGDRIYLTADGVWYMDSRGVIRKLSKEISIVGLHGIQYNACTGYVGAYAGIERTAWPRKQSTSKKNSSTSGTAPQPWKRHKSNRRPWEV